MVKRWKDTLGITVELGVVQGSDEAFRHSKEWEEKADVYYAQAVRLQLADLKNQLLSKEKPSPNAELTEE